MLFALPLALLPLAIHLLNRMRHRVVRWGAMMFVLKAARSSTRMSKIKWWLILLSRVLAIAVFVMAIAKPLAGGWLGWRLSGDPDTILVLLDRSASMGAFNSPGVSKRSQAVSMLSETGARVASSSRGVLIDGATSSSEAIPGWSVLGEMGRSGETQTAANVPAMFRKALDYILENDTGDTEIWVASDLQASNWKVENPEWGDLDTGFKALPGAVAFRILALDATVKGNGFVAFEDLLTRQTTRGPIRELALDVVSGGGGGEIPLTIDDGQSTRQVSVKLESGRARIRVPLAAKKKDALIYGGVSLPPDTNPNDNTAYFAAGAPVTEKVVVFARDAAAERVLMAAAAPEGEEAYQKAVGISASSWFAADSLADVALVIWQAPYPSREISKRLEAFAESGGMVLFFPPGKLSEGKSGEGVSWGRVENAPEKKDGAWAVGDWNRREGPLANTLSGDPLPLDDLRFARFQLLRGARGAETLASDIRGEPFLLEKRIGNGAFVFCRTLPTAAWSNLGDGLVLVPLARRLARAGAERLAKVSFKECGDWTPESGEATLLFPVPKDAAERVVTMPVMAGVYQDGEKIVVLNRPALENLSAVISGTEAEGALASNNVHMFHDAGGGAESGKMAGMWWFFLAMALAFLTLEGVLCLPGRVKTSDVATA
jgi:hypothetical protein